MYRCIPWFVVVWISLRSAWSIFPVSECDDPNLNMEDVLTHLSFIRINIDSIALPEGNPLIERLFQEGFNLEYQFPCLENVSRSLRAPVRIPAKSFTMTNIQFRHRRVVLVQLAAEIIPLWKRSQLVVRLHVQLNTRGKFSTRLLAHCVVPLTELVTPPFLICRDFNFVPEKGMQFEGTSLIRIDLGTREKKLNEKLSEMRNPVLESTYVVDDVRLVFVNFGVFVRFLLQESNRPMPFRERLPSNLTDTSDSVFEDRSHAYAHTMELHREFRPAVRSSVSSGSRERERESPRRKSFIQLTVHEARGLPLVLDERNRFVSPNAYVSVLGRDGELRSAVCEQSRRPLWNWTARFCICGERRNIIVKIFHHDISGDQARLKHIPRHFLARVQLLPFVRKIEFEELHLRCKVN
ncbi:unnamed protein product [Heligmosomoides polygyrus]|uniref:C2 domain-containing protein n=1 Tax=Heligmosomoides polygyrus TaxID=6339 RepID=A0A183GM81_HELPZ|nr:unnamed protein product [Heligmosomoides polygyrus]